MVPVAGRHLDSSDSVLSPSGVLHHDNAPTSDVKHKWTNCIFCGFLLLVSVTLVSKVSVHLLKYSFDEYHS